MERVHLLDDSIVSAELVNWIRQECGLAELADELDVYVRKHVSVAAFVSTIFERTGMYDNSTVKQVDRILKEQSNLTITEKYKKRAEYLYQQGRFRQALVIYRELAEYIPSRDSAGKALLYYNMASIYAMDFAFKQAADLYYEAYLLHPDRQTRCAYILANRKALTDYAYGAFKRENPNWEEDFLKVEQMCAQADEKWLASRERKLVTELAELKDSGQMEAYRQQSQTVIRQLKKDYKRQTKN
ncbi:MAG: tetratricopeptide repeat protein [Lachnospiraceae bacterium]|nr:tetratricopeptide repeat protein [Lachnospiraceae bacterium]